MLNQQVLCKYQTESYEEMIAFISHLQFRKNKRSVTFCGGRSGGKQLLQMSISIVTILPRANLAICSKSL